MLVAAGMVTEAQVREALARQKETGARLGETLVALGYVSEPQMTQVLSNQLTIPWVNLYHVDFSRELLDLVPADVAETYCLIPVYIRHVRRQGDTLYVAMDDPLNVDALQRVADSAGLPVKPMVASPTDIRNAIRVYYLGLPPLDEEEADEVEALEALEEVEEAAEAPPAPEGPAEPKPEAAAAGEPAAASEEPAEPTALEAPEAPEAREDADEGPTATPSMPPPPRSGTGFLTLTLLDGTTVRLPSPGAAQRGPAQEAPKSAPERGLTTRDLIHALRARAAGEDVGDVLPDDAWEPLFATLLSVLLRKGLVADWEFVDEWKKQTKKRGPKKT